MHGHLDSVTSPAGGQVRVAGWALSTQHPHNNLNIHVFVGGPSGVGEGRNLASATWRSRPDVAALHPIGGGSSGFIETFTTARRGWQWVYAYAINPGGGANRFLGREQVHITEPAPVSQPINSWARLRDAINRAPSGSSTIHIEGSFEAPATASGSAIRIPEGRNILLTSNNSTRRTITQIRHSSRTEVQRHFVVSEGATLRLGSNITLAGRGAGNRGGVSSLHYFCWQGLLTKIR